MFEHCTDPGRKVKESRDGSASEPEEPFHESIHAGGTIMKHHRRHTVRLQTTFWVIVLVLWTSVATYAQTVNCSEPTAGLVGCWPFNGNANDESVNSNNGIVNGATLTTDRFGDTNSAYHFDGVDDLIDFGDVDILDNAPEATISIWIRYSNHTDFYDPFIAKGPIAAGNPYHINRSSSEIIGASFQGTGGASAAETSNQADDGNWHHVVATFKNKEVKIYIDNILSSIPAGSDCTNIKNDSNPLTLGFNQGPTRQFWYEGDIDEVRIYNRALSETEIQTLFQEGTNQPPVADAGSDQTVECADASGAPVTLDGSGSSDPDLDPLTYTWTGPFGTATGVSPTVTLPLGTHPITLTVDDGNSETDTDEVVVTVEDTTLPVLSVSTDPITLWPPNHTYHTIALGNVVTGVSDACGANLTVEDAIIITTSSDEPENANGDGNTLDDIVIGTDCRTVDLRAERRGGGDGRVYTVEVAIADASGNEGTAMFQVTVPKSKKSTAIDDGPSYTVAGTCEPSSPMASMHDANTSPVDAGVSRITAGVPESYYLGQNYPNPFNPTTTISYALPSAQAVSLTVYDILGREVATLVNDVQRAGQYSVRFDASHLPSGVYLYHWQAGEFTEMKTMLLAK